MEHVIQAMQRPETEMKGTISGEHGTDLGHCDMLVEEVGAESIDTMTKTRVVLDPLRLLDPDKIIRISGKVDSP